MRGSSSRLWSDTDASARFKRHGQNALELELMVKAGITTMQAIGASTARGAEILGLKAGAVREGYLADFLAVEGNPYQDVTCL